MKYIVTIREVHSMEVPVDASSEEEARSKVSEWLAETNDNIPYDLLEYSHTEDVCKWGVEKA